MSLVELQICPHSCCRHNHHTRLSCRGKHPRDCWVLTDMCHINMSQITFTPTNLIFTHTIALWGLSLWYADSSSHLEKLRHHSRRVHYWTRLCSSEGVREFFFFFIGCFVNLSFMTNSQSVYFFRSSMSLCRVTQWLCTWDVMESWAQKMKACLTFFPTRRVARHDRFLPAQTTSYTKSKIIAVYIHLSSAPHSLIRPQLGRT